MGKKKISSRPRNESVLFGTLNSILSHSLLSVFEKEKRKGEDDLLVFLHSSLPISCGAASGM